MSLNITILIPKNTPEGQRLLLTLIAIQKAAELGAQKHFGGRIPTNVANTLKDGDIEVDDLGELKKIKNPEMEGMYDYQCSKVLAQRNNPRYMEKVSTTFAYSGDGRR